MIGSTFETCENWLKIYNTNIYNKSVFYKGPLLSAMTKLNEIVSSARFISIKSYKANIKQALLAIQSSHDACEWVNDNFILYNIAGLRKSSRHAEKISYTIFF